MVHIAEDFSQENPILLGNRLDGDTNVRTGIAKSRIPLVSIAYTNSGFSERVTFMY